MALQVATGIVLAAAFLLLLRWLFFSSLGGKVVPQDGLSNRKNQLSKPSVAQFCLPGVEFVVDFSVMGLTIEINDTKIDHYAEEAHRLRVVDGKFECSCIYKRDLTEPCPEILKGEVFFVNLGLLGGREQQSKTLSHIAWSPLQKEFNDYLMLRYEEYRAFCLKFPEVA